MDPEQHMNFWWYLKSKKDLIDCHPYESFCQTCTNTWLKLGQECLAHGHEFHELKETNFETCLVFFDGHKSCYHGFKKFLVRGDTLETFYGRTICKGFRASPFGQEYQ